MKAKAPQLFIVHCSLFVFLLLAGIAGVFFLKARRPGPQPIFAESAVAALGGFRSLAAEAVWFRIDRLQAEGRYVELAQLANTLTFLEPHVPDVWTYSAWNLAYNISIMMPTAEDRWRWVKAAITMLRDRGLAFNPEECDIYRELAFYFEIKIGTDLDSAASLYREKWTEIVKDVTARNAWSELAMDPEKMKVVERKYAVSDWTSPFASALYWAEAGLPYAGPKERGMLEQIVVQSHRLYHYGIHPKRL